MAAEITQIDVTTLNQPEYHLQDVNLIPTFNVDNTLTSSSKIEFYVYNVNNELLYAEPDFTQYTVENDPNSDGTSVSQIILNPEMDLMNNGFIQGEYIAYYNFLDNKIGSPIEPLYIAEISSDRTEIRLDSTFLTDLDILEKTTAFITDRDTSTYFVDFYLNFGDNNLAIANNIILSDDDATNSTILVKLYEPLPESIQLKDTLWVVTAIEEPLAYSVVFEDEPIIFDDTVRAKGPNFNIDINDKIGNSTLETTLQDLLNTPQTNLQNQINSLLEEKEIDVNIDYTEYPNFIHFSSAKTRLENFYYKMQLLEQYSSSIAILDNTTTSTQVSSSKSTYENQISNVITNFDGYEYYLYYNSGSYAWPKSNTTQPYENAKTDDAITLTWLGSDNENDPYYGGQTLIASLYDINNPDYLYYTIPEYLREDPANEPYLLFVDMIAQHYDNIWIYYNEVSQKYNADNRLEYGISKDIVADAIRDFGVKLYQNNFNTDDLFTAFVGLTSNGSLFPFPEITGSYPTPSGFEYVDTLISASNDNMPLDDANKSLYKRLYHNIPYLLKSKGTLAGLRALITSYGIPNTILRINEYGGKDKVNTNDYDYWKNEFNYAFSTSGSNFISSSWHLNTEWDAPDDTPASLMFRFKTDGLPEQNIPYSQSLWYGDGGSAITLTYTGSAYASGSYDGSPIDPEYQFATLTFYPSTANNTSTASVYLPFFDGNWWSVMVNRENEGFNLYVKNNQYGTGDNNTIVGFSASDNISFTDSYWNNTNISYFPAAFNVNDPMGYDVAVYDVNIYDENGTVTSTYSPFTGSYQEIRYYANAISESVFADYTMNPYSIEGNSLNTSADELAFRASIGGELYMQPQSIHPRIDGIWGTRHSFANDSNFYYDLTPHFVPNVEYFQFDTPVAGIRVPISDKIRVENNVIAEGNTLSAFRSLTQYTNASASYTPGVNYMEVAFSPQNEINDDIIGQIGSFNIGEFIGDPRYRSSSNYTYNDLNTLRNDYFQKYTKNYNLRDFIRLIKFFDNSLFKMIRDFVPARTGLASGIVIKQHILERNRYSQPQMSHAFTELSASVKPRWNGYNEGTIETMEGGAAGSVNKYNTGSNTEQQWTVTVPSSLGDIQYTHNSQDEFYNGELSGSHLVATTQSLSGSQERLSFTEAYPTTLFNNITEPRPNPYIQDVDYSFGATTPVNNDYLLSGSATRGTVPVSNYTTKRIVNPRYDGVKNTSTQLNVWSSSSLNEGNYGKTPSMESLKTAVAYCESITGWPPEHIDASSVNIVYLIHADGTVTKPNVSENSLEITQGNFISGERVIINYSNKVDDTLPVGGTDQNLPSREIIRGGSRIEPILHNQIGWNPPNWVDVPNIEFKNWIKPAVGNYETPITFPLYESPVEAANDSDLKTYTPFILFPNSMITDSIQTYSMTISLAIKKASNDGGGDDFGVLIGLRRRPNPSAAWETVNSDYLSPWPDYWTGSNDGKDYIYNYSKTLNFTKSQINQYSGYEYQLAILFEGIPAITGIPGQRDWNLENGSITFNQYPNPGEQPTLIIPSNLWVSASNGTYSMYTTQSDVVSMFKQNLTSSTWYMKDITTPISSGFNPILTPWGIERGDVFRFESDEEKTYMVNYVETGSVGGNDSINVYFGAPLPTSPTLNDVNKYSLTRYVDDASKVVIKGYRPSKSTGPYIVRPEYVVPELNKGIDEFIVDLTQKGLL
jgi:hypothetical protein